MRRPEKFSHFEAALPSIRLHFVREGAGTPVFLVHGWPGFWWEWHRNIGELATTFDVVAADMRGFGDSEKPPLEQIDLFHVDRVVDDFVGLMDHLGFEQAFFAGHDYGGVMIHKLIRRYPERVARAAILNPMVPGFDERYLSAGNFHESWYAMFHRLDLAADLVASSRETCRMYIRHFLRHWSFDPGVFDEQMIEAYVDSFVKPGNIRAGFNFYRADPPWANIDHTISTKPVLFLQSMNDPCAPAAWSDLVTRWYADFRIEYVDRAGHFLMIERPEIVNDRLRAFFSA